MALAARVAIITGAASGLGKATALRLARAGARVALLDLPSQPGSDVAKQIGDAAISIPTDVTSEEQVKAALDMVYARFGKLNAVVQCAGIGVAARILGRKGPHSLADFQRVLTVNTVGIFNVLRLSAERMAAGTPDDAAERGVIINTARRA